MGGHTNKQTSSNIINIDYGESVIIICTYHDLFNQLKIKLHFFSRKWEQDLEFEYMESKSQNYSGYLKNITHEINSHVGKTPVHEWAKLRWESKV